MKKIRTPVKAAAAVIAVLILIKIAVRLLPFPELKQFQNRTYSTVVYDCDNQVIQYIPLKNGLRREYSSIKKIPSTVKKAFIRAEDRRFYFHNGVDYLSIARALFQNIRGKRNISGASTITMQLARIISPSEKRDASAKLKDIINAYKLEERLSKNQILELYLNNIPFGKNTEGVTSAAKTFFAANLEDLSELQACCLAVIPRSPTLYNPLDNPENCAKAACKILSQKKDYEKLIQTAYSAESFEYPVFMPHYINFLRKNYAAELENPEIHLPVSLDLQNYCQSVLERSMEDSSESRIYNGALLVMDVKTGNILAWIGNIDWNDRGNSGEIDGVTNCIQPGSSMKPFLYALALDNNLISTTSVLPDVPKNFGNENLYIPQNFNNRYNGCVSVRVALASSLNIPAVDLLNLTGIPTYIEKLHQMDINSIKTGYDYGLGLALGNGEVSLYELVPAFSTFVKDGFFIKPKPFISADKKNPEPVQIYTEDTSRLICSILSDKKSRALGFGLTQTFETDYPSIFKTGTANQYQNIIALGATSNYAVGVWMGNFNGNTVIGKTGSSLPAWTAKQILDYLEKGTEHEDFPSPQNYHLEKVCSLSMRKPGPYCLDCVYEYVKNGDSLDQCSWHQKDSLNLPSEYEYWAKLYEKNINIDYSDSELEILSPANKSIFYLDPSVSEALQAVPLIINGGNDPVIKIFVDGEFYNEIDRSTSENISLPMKKGPHEITVYCSATSVSADYLIK